MKLIELKKKVAEFKATRSIRLAYEICDGLVEDFENSEKSEEKKVISLIKMEKKHD